MKPSYKRRDSKNNLNSLMNGRKKPNLSTTNEQYIMDLTKYKNKKLARSMINDRTQPVLGKSIHGSGLQSRSNLKNILNHKNKLRHSQDSNKKDSEVRKMRGSRDYFGLYRQHSSKKYKNLDKSSNLKNSKEEPLGARKPSRGSKSGLGLLDGKNGRRNKSRKGSTRQSLSRCKFLNFQIFGCPFCPKKQVVDQ